MSPNVKHYFDGFEKDTLKWNQNLTYESMLKTQKKNHHCYTIPNRVRTNIWLGKLRDVLNLCVKRKRN